MNTLIYVSCLGFFCMIAEILNQRKLIIPVLVLALAVIFGLNLSDWNHGQTYFNNMVQVDNFSVAFSGLAIFITLLLFILASEFYAASDTHISDYSAIIVFILCGALMMFNFNNLAMLFIGIETLSISLYVMAGSRRFEVKSNEAGFKYFLMGSFMSGFLLFGIALIYGASGTFYLDKIYQYTQTNSANLPVTFHVGAVLIVFAMLFKTSSAPFHFWAPDVYEGSPTLITAMMSTLVKVAAFAAFYRLLSHTFLYVFPSVETVIAISAVLTVSIGNFIALNQTNFKRLLAYSGISHAGYLLLAVISLRGNTESSLLYYAVGYSVSTLAAFSVAMLVFKAAGNENIDALNGLGKKNPLMAATLTMAMLSLAGIPPFAGFFGKYYIFSEAMKNGYFYLVLVAIINSIIGVFYYFKPILAMYGQPANEIEVKTNYANNLVLWICLALSLALGLFPDLIADLL